MEKVTGTVTSAVDFLQFGPNMIVNIGKKISNNFWKQIFCAVNNFMQGAIFCNPEKIIIAPFWDNPIIQKNNKPIKKSAFPEIAQKVRTVSDFYRPGSHEFLTKKEFDQKYQCEIGEDNLLEIHYILTTAKRGIGINDNNQIMNVLPFQPLLINMVNLTKKGCSIYSKFLKKKENLSTNLSHRENKWHLELQQTFGVDFWNKTYLMTSNIKNENKIKWFQFQLNRNSLFTNYKVNKFKPQISKYCSYCSHIEGFSHLELVSHLFFDCDFVLKLWQEIKTWLATLNITLPLDRKKILFGIHDEAIFSPTNYLILCNKYFIWRSKFLSKDLSLGLFQKYLLAKLNDQRNALIYCEKLHQFDKCYL